VLENTNDNVAVFNLVLDLAPYEFPSDARIFVEAYRQTSVMRFDFVPFPRRLRRWTGRCWTFRVPMKFSFASGSPRPQANPGVLMGEADQIRPRKKEELPDLRLPLLPAIPDDLGEEVWRIDFNNGTWLVVSRDLPNWKQTVSSDTFRALVYPAAMRQILQRILYTEVYRDIEDPDDWRSRWLAFQR